MDGEWTTADAMRRLRKPTATDDKYSRGVVGIRTGSDLYPGAAVLGVEAAWRTGIGMVRYLGPSRAEALVLARRPETVTKTGRVQAWVIGSGTDAATRTAAETAELRGILAADLPVVVDAGALDLVTGSALAPFVVTPHEREHAALRRRLGVPDEPDRIVAARSTARALGGTVVLKGARTIVASAAGDVYTLHSPTSWLATAGTGDVLAGIIGALLAAAAADGAITEAAATAPYAATGVWLHGRAAALASADRGGGPITALDVAEALPHAVGELIGPA